MFKSVVLKSRQYKKKVEITREPRCETRGYVHPQTPNDNPGELVNLPGNN